MRQDAGATSDSTVHDLVARAAARWPDRVAVEVDGLATTHDELARLASSAQAHLQEAGVRPGDRVAVCCDRSPELIAVLVGVLRAGACYVPLDRRDPAERIALTLDAATPRVVVTDAVTDALIARDPRPGLTSHTVLHPAAVCAPAAGAEHGVSAVRCAEGAAAYVLPTSGSSGRPKLVVMPHRALTNLLDWHLRERSSVDGSRTSQLCSLSFDFAFHEIFSTLCGGGTLVVAPDEARVNGAALAAFVERAKITRLFAAVPMLQRLAADRSADLASLKEVVTTGEALHLTASLRGLLRRTEGWLHNHYGASEFQDATTFSCTADGPWWGGTAPAGTPVSGVGVEIHDPESGRPLPAGTVGEVVITGAGLADGYLAAGPALPTATVTSPVRRGFGTDGPGGRRLYRTGDRGHLDEYEVLHIGGRLDDQVKVDGARVEPAAIEAFVMADPRVEQVAVTVASTQSGDALVAHVVLADLRGASPGDVAADLADRVRCELPASHLPARWQVHESLPSTPSGKLDRRALAAGGVVVRPRRDPVRAPTSPAQLQVLHAWRTVLGLTHISIDDRFRDLGGTSLQVLDVRRRIAEATGHELALNDVIAAHTVRAQAELLTALPPRAAEQKTRGPADRHPTALVLDGRAGHRPYEEAPESVASTLHALERARLAVDLVAGVGRGEVVAAAVAGVLTVADATTLSRARSRLVHLARRRGSAVALRHLRDVAESLSYRPPTATLLTGTVGGVVGEQVCDPLYWSEQPLREPRRRELMRTLGEAAPALVVTPTNDGRPMPFVQHALSATSLVVGCRLEELGRVRLEQNAVVG